MLLVCIKDNHVEEIIPTKGNLVVMIIKDFQERIGRDTTPEETREIIKSVKNKETFYYHTEYHMVWGQEVYSWSYQEL